MLTLRSSSALIADDYNSHLAIWAEKPLQTIALPKNRPPARGLTIASSALVLAILLPLIAVLVLAATAVAKPGILIELMQSVLVEYTLNTLILAVIAGLVALGIGLPGAWFLSAYEFTGRRLMSWSLVVPMALPAYVLAYAYTDALDPSGWLYQAIAAQFMQMGVALPRIDIRSIWGAGIILGVALSPYVSLLARAAFEERQGASFDAARVMGLTPTQIFFRLALPLARPAWIAGLALVVMECFADYGTVAFFSVPTLSTGLFKAWFGYGDRASAALIAVMMLIFVFALLWIEISARGRAQWASQRAGTRANRSVVKGGKAFGMAMFCAIPGLIGFVFPVLLLIETATAAHAMPNFSALFSQATATIILGMAAVAVILPAAWICAYVLRQGSSISVKAVRIASAGYAVPGLVVAVGLLAWSSLFTQAMDQWFDWRIALVSTGVLLIGAYLTRFFSVGLGSIESGLGRVTKNLEWSASSLGLTPLQIFWRVHLPLMRRATGVAALLVFVDVVKELPATLVLRPFNVETLAVAAHHFAADELLSQAAWPAILIGLVGLVPLMLLGPALKRS
jgi:iron(III) transport system permease protein